MMSTILRSYGARLHSIRREYLPNYNLSSSSSYEECSRSGMLQSSLNGIGHEQGGFSNLSTSISNTTLTATTTTQSTMSPQTNECGIIVGDDSRNQTLTSKEEKIDERGSISTVISYPITSDSDIAELPRYVSNIKLDVGSILNRLGTNNSNDNNNTAGGSNTICLSLQQLPQLMKKFNKYNMKILNDIKFNPSYLSDILTSLLKQSDNKVGALNEVVSLLLQIKSKLQSKATTIMQQIVQQKWIKMVRDIDVASYNPHDYYYCYSSYFNLLSLSENLQDSFGDRMIDIIRQWCIKTRELESNDDTIVCESKLADSMNLLDNQIDKLRDDAFLHQHPFMMQIFSNLFHKIASSVAKQWGNENGDVKWHFVQRHWHLQVKLLETVQYLYSHHNVSMKKQGGCYDITSVKQELSVFNELYVALGGALDDEKEYLHDVPSVKLQPFEVLFKLVVAEYIQNGKRITCNIKNILNSPESSRVHYILGYFMCLIEIILGQTGEIIEEDLVLLIIQFILDIMQYTFQIMVNDTIYMMNNFEAIKVFIEKLVKVMVDVVLYVEDFKCSGSFNARIDCTINLIDKALQFMIRKSDLFAGDLTKFQHTMNSTISKTIGSNKKQIKSLMDIEKLFSRPMATSRTKFALSKKSGCYSLCKHKTTKISHQRKNSAGSDAKYKRLSCFEVMDIRFVPSSAKNNINSCASVDNSSEMDGSFKTLSYKQLSFGGSRKSLIETKFGENEYIQVVFPRLSQISCVKAQVTFSSNRYGNTDKNNRLEYWDINKGQYTTVQSFVCPCLCGGSNSVMIYDVNIITNKMRFVTEKGFVGLSFFKIE